MKRFIYVLCLFITPVFGQESKIDSLITIYHNQTIDSLKIKSLKKICDYYFFSNVEEGFKFADSIAALGIKSGENKWISFGFKFRGNAFTRKGKFKEAIEEFQKGIDLQDSIGEEQNKYASYMNIGTAYRYARDFDSANVYYNKAINIAAKYDKKDRLIVIYNNLGSMAMAQEKPDQGVAYFMKALENIKYNNNPKREISTLINLGTIHYDLNQFEKALEYSQEALIISNKEEYLIGIADSKKNLGKIYVAQKTKLKKAIKLLSEASKIYKDLNDLIFLLEVYSSLGVAFEIENDIENAIKYHNKAVELSEEINMLDNVFGSRVALAKAQLKNDNIKQANIELNYILKDTLNKYLLDNQLVIAYETKAEISRLTGDYKTAYKYHKRFKNLNDKIMSVEKLSNINELETKYQTEKKEKENLQLKADKVKNELALEKENKQKWFFGSLSLIAILTIIVFVFYTKNRRQKLLYKSQLDIAKAKQTEHQRIATDLHDYKVKTLEEIEVELTKEGRIQLANKVETIKENIRKLSKELSHISFEESEFDDQIITLLASYSSEDITIHQEGIESINWKSTNDTIKQNLFLVIREGISNAYNHSEAKNVHLKFQKKGKQLQITITDDGKGFDEMTPGIGFTNMKLRINEINGKIKIESKKEAGTQIGIYLAL